MSLNQTITATEAVSPESPTPGVAQWNQFYGVPANVVTVTASIVHNPDGPSGSSTVLESGTQVGNSVISNPTPYWWPDLTNMTPGSFHSTPYTGPPQPITQ